MVYIILYKQYNYTILCVTLKPFLDTETLAVPFINTVSIILYILFYVLY